ncbi:DNA-directed RNA polymerase I subunit RPA49 [Tanacetum coccineum]
MVIREDHSDFEDMLRAWSLMVKASTAHFRAFVYGSKCRAPICWDEVGERLIEGPELIEITNEKVAVAKEKLKEARSRQKSYADKHRRDLEFQTGDRIFRLEPRFDDEVNPADENLKLRKLMRKEKDLQISTKKSEQTLLIELNTFLPAAPDLTALHASRDLKAQADLNSKMADAKVNAKVLEVGAATTSNARNIPPHDLLATRPRQAYPLEKIIFKGEWKYLLDIAEILKEEKDITPESYPVFVCNRIHKINEAKDEEERKSLACIYSYINHLIKFNDKHSRFSSTKHHKLPNILTQKFHDMFAITEPKSRLSDDKRDLLISYVLVLTLIVDNFKTEFSDIAKDLRMPTGALRPHFEVLGCKFTRENNITLATLPAPLKLPEVKMKRRR